MLSTSKGLDVDHDTKREFIIKVADVGGNTSGRFEFYECTADNSFALVHVIDITDEGSFVSYYPGDVGDADGDGLAELIIFGRVHSDFYVRLYESQSVATYPTDLVWEHGGHINDGFGWQLGAKISDTDDDGLQEIVAGGVFFDLLDHVVVYENDGDNSYHLAYTDLIPGILGQSIGVLNDLDGDGRDEILYGGIPEIEDFIYAYESTGDDSYEIIWTWDFDPGINVQFIVDAGDTDNDGKKEFLAGGFAGGDSHLHVFEVIEDDDFQIVATFTRPNSANAYSDANVADVDGDGRKEILFSTTWGFSIYQNTGNDTWHEIWSGPAGPIESIGAGDHDQDGKEEIIVRDGDWTEGVTTIFEIHPADAADMDMDGTVNIIDNCPTVVNFTQADADRDDVGDACSGRTLRRHRPTSSSGLATRSTEKQTDAERV